MAKINKINHIKCWNGYDLTRILIYYWWELVMINHFGKAISHKDMYICVRVCVYVWREWNKVIQDHLQVISDYP